MAKTIRASVPDDLIRKIYKTEGWVLGDKGGYSTRVGRCKSLYDIVADPRANRYIATRKA